MSDTSTSQTQTDPAPAPQAPAENQSETDGEQKLTFLQMLGSTLAAAFGVQSSKNRERDFTQGKASHFIFMGIAFTIVFVLLMVTLVSFVLP